MSVLRVGTYNVCHGLGLDRRLDLQRTAAVLRRLDADVITVQEVDLGCRRSGGIDQAAELARLTGMAWCFAPAIVFQGGLYGHLVLSRLPVLSWQAHALPGEEPRCVLAVDLNWDGQVIRFCGTHLDLDPGQRHLSLPILQQVAERRGVPFVLAGDFNSTPDSAIIRHFATVWQTGGSPDGQATYPADAPTAQIDHVLAGPAGCWRTLSTEVVADAVASDHRPVRVELALTGRPQ